MSAIGRRVFAACVTSFSLVACSAIWGFDDLRLGQPMGDGGAADADDGGERPNPDAEGSLKTANKVDILFVVDNSASMFPKQRLLVRSLNELLGAAAATKDVHVGIITSSLGVGGDICPSGTATGRLIGGRYLVYGAVSDVTDFESSVQSLIGAATDKGCGFPAPLETLYRFLVAPDPWFSVDTGEKKASYLGTEEILLMQRAQFLRPDSLLVIVMVTDKEDASLDPLSYGGLGWAFSSTKFPDSTVTRADGVSTTAPRATDICKVNPGDPGCTSCKCIDEPCPGLGSDPSCVLDGGYYGKTEDFLASRFHKMKQRYGRDPQYPVSRYVQGLTKVRVPRRGEEHRETTTEGRRLIADYDTKAAACTNPIFAARLPTSSTEELCALPVGERDKSLVLFAVVAGVPPSLIGTNGTPKDWASVLGSDPAGYSDDGKDPHMIQSVLPRSGLPPPVDERGNNGTDPDHGREWTTGDELQFACTAELVPPGACTASEASCDCAGAKNPPLCGPTVGEQTRMKAFPSTRPLRVARDLGDRAVVGSVCQPSADAYTSTLRVLAQRVSARVAK